MATARELGAEVNVQDAGADAVSYTHLDFSRIRKDSFYWYKKVIESCGEELN